MKLRVAYNAPVVLTFALLAAVVTCLPESIRHQYFTSPVRMEGIASYFALVSNILGHANWTHYIGNFTMILLIGPILEERYGSMRLLFMIVITAVVSGVIDLVLGHPTLGASGIVFMMIVLASTANIKEGEVPLTFIAIATLYLGGEIYAAFTKDDNVSHLGHLMGGLAGAAFGFLGARSKVALKKGSGPTVDNLGLPAADLLKDGPRKKKID